jgi:hypothetical protein
MLPEENVAAFFAYARKRHAIYLKRQAGEPPPWTPDPILQQFRFTNVFRELDKTTLWFKEFVREPLYADPKVLLATVVFRWFNTIRTGETLFCQLDMFNKSPFEYFVEMQDVRALRPWLRKQGPPYVTGSYMIRSKDNMDKLEGVLYYIQKFTTESYWREWAEDLLDRPGAYTLEQTWLSFCAQEGLGPFLAYEIVTDLRHTALLNRAKDIRTWANPGPGARRGIARLMDPNAERRMTPTGKMRVVKANVKQSIEGMRELLNYSLDHRIWPLNWPEWEMREVEHTLCEFDKYERVRLGHGRPRQVFRSAA